MSDIADDIAAVVAARRLRAPQVRTEVTHWRAADVALAELCDAVGRLCDDVGTPVDVADQLEQLCVGVRRPMVTRAIELLQWLETRFVRHTVCVGIGGVAGAGKSTLLQSISGLADGQLPVGAAVPIWLRHTTGRRRAVLSLHSYDSFRATHLQPRYTRAGLGLAPADIDSFRVADLGSSSSPVVEELHAMQEALSTYEGLLDRPRRLLELGGDELDRLAEYVAYPQVDRGSAGRYLAVRGATIELPFPRAEHAGLTLVDMPELPVDTATLARRWVLDVRHDVDVMLHLIKYDAESGSDPGPPPVGRGDRLVLSIHNGAGGAGSPSLRGERIEVDCRDPSDVSTRLLRPMLRRLLEQLPALDDRASAQTRARIRPVQDDLIGVATQVKAILGQVPAVAQSTTTEVYRRSDDLHDRLTTTLRELLDELHAEAESERQRYRALVSRIHADLMRWVRDGLGRGQERWCAEAQRGVARAGAVAFIRSQLNRAQSEIADRCAALDGYLRGRLDRVWTKLALVLYRELGGILSGRTGTEALIHLGRLATATTEPALGLAAAVDEVLTIRLDYRTYLDPPVSGALRPLVDAAPAVPESGADAARLLEIIQGLTERAAGQVQLELLGHASLPEQVLEAVVAHFVDALTTGPSAREDVRRLARAYRRQLWPDLVEDLDEAAAGVAEVFRAADNVLASLTRLTTPAPVGVLP
jgi:hypothetical protein